ncbi:ATP-binding protein [Corynebacterium variabile]|uniref:ATP-binding protein n=1 Tax=Corynebacterium variabile TaxID=1727 RepID=UPI003456A4ED
MPPRPPDRGRRQLPRHPGSSPEARPTGTPPPANRSRRRHRTGVCAGLGLAVAQRIVTAHGGVLDLAPRAEGGLTVSVTFPEKDS